MLIILKLITEVHLLHYILLLFFLFIIFDEPLKADEADAAFLLQLNDKANLTSKTLTALFVCLMNVEEKSLLSFRTNKEAAAEWDTF